MGSQLPHPLAYYLGRFLVI